MAHVIIDDISPRISHVVGATPRTEFEVPFAFFEESDLVVTVGPDTFVLDTDYTVDGITADGGFQGGTVTLEDAVTSITVTIERNVPIERTTDFPDSGPLNIKALNTQFDKLFAILQDQDIPASDLEQQLNDLIAQLSAILTQEAVTVNFATAAAVEAVDVSILTLYVRTAGYTTEGDGGGALYKRVASEPSHIGKIQSSDGTWFELAELEPNIKQFGAEGGAADDTDIMEGAAAYCIAKGNRYLKVPAGTWSMHAVLNVSGLTIEGIRDQTIICNNSTNGAAITFGNGTDEGNSNTLRNVLLAQSASVVPDGVNNKALWLRKQNHFVGEHLFIHSFPAPCTDAVIIEDSYEVHVTHLIASSPLRDGLVVDACINFFLWDSQIAVSGRNGVTYVGPCAGVHMERVETLQNLVGVKILKGSGANDLNQDFYLTKVISDGNISNNWEISQLASAHFSQCWGCTQFDEVTDPAARGWVLTGSDTRNLRFVDCMGNNNNGDGWAVLDIGTGMPGEIYWTNCEFGNNDTTPYLGGPPDPRGNGKAGAGFGIAIANSTERFVIEGGTAMNNATANTSFGTQTKLIVDNLVGYNPVGLSAVTVGASPFTYTNGPTRTTLFIGAGTVSSITVDGIACWAHSEVTVPLEPNQVCVVTYSVLPGITQSKH
jgi:hypothetical protein